MPRRMRSAWGTVERVRDGVWRLRYWADAHDGRGYARHSETVRGTRRDAWDVLAARHVAHGQDSPTMTLGECAERFWRPECADRLARGDLRPKTLENYENIWRRHVAPRWGDVPVAEIDPLELQEWLLTKTEAIGSRCQVVMRAILRLAVLYRLVPANVAAEDYRRSGEARSQSRAVWSLAECDEMCRQLRQTPHGSVLEAPAIMCAFGSCRVGEACGLALSDLETREAPNGMRVVSAHVHGQLLKGMREVQPYTKTDSSERWVVVPEPWSLRLEEVVAAGRAAGWSWLCDDGTGAPVPRDTMQGWWRDAFAEGGPLAGHEWGPMRNLRASWRTNMRSTMRMDRDVLEKMMGHEGKGVGEVHYFRPDVEEFTDEIACAFRARDWKI